MPEIKIKHVVSFTSEDKVHKAGNLLKPEMYYKWKCASPGETKASVILQLEKASVIHSIDIGNEHSAFAEVLVKRSSDENSDFQVLLVASSFMSPLESRNSTNPNRVRMFHDEKLTKNLKDEKWDTIQIVCTQPFNKNVQYGLSFIKFHSPPDASEESKQEGSKGSERMIGKFKLKEDSESDTLDIKPYFNFMKKKNESADEIPATSPSAIKQASFAAATLANLEKSYPTANVSSQKRRHSNDTPSAPTPPSKKQSSITRVDKSQIKHRSILGSDSDGEDAPIQIKSRYVNSVKVSPETARDEPTTSKHSKEGSHREINSERRIVEKEVSRKKEIPLNKIMEKVVFVLSGFQNPYRSDLRDAALEMGAKYKADWDSTCTHLVCAFANTPKYLQVVGSGGRIVTKEWILDCRKKKELLPWRKYMLGKYTKDPSSEEDDSEDEWTLGKKKKEHIIIKKNPGIVKPDNPKTNLTKPGSPKTNLTKPDSPKTASPRKDHNPELSKKKSHVPALSHENRHSNSGTDADDDYLASTDVDDDSGSDDKEEILRIKQKATRRNVSESPDSKTSGKSDKVRKKENGGILNGIVGETGSDFEKPDTKDIPLMDLPDFFKGGYFFLYGKFSEEELHDLERYITAYNGRIANYMGDEVKYVITKSEWSQHFDEALENNDNLIFVRPSWVYKCHQSAKFVPFQPFIVVPVT